MGFCSVVLLNQFQLLSRRYRASQCEEFGGFESFGVRRDFAIFNGYLPGFWITNRSILAV